MNSSWRKLQNKHKGETGLVIGNGRGPLAKQCGGEGRAGCRAVPRRSRPGNRRARGLRPRTGRPKRCGKSPPEGQRVASGVASGTGVAHRIPPG